VVVDEEVGFRVKPCPGQNAPGLLLHLVGDGDVGEGVHHLGKEAGLLPDPFPQPQGEAEGGQGLPGPRGGGEGEVGGEEAL
jgi:hypothetical protein